jgi:muramoyltetrapeptide carboxypeptidase
MIVPPALRPGDRIDVIAPSSPFDRALAWRGLGWLKQRYQVHFDPNLFEVTGYLAGSDERRRTELDRALNSTETRAIVAVRGGYGLNRIAHRLDWESLRDRPKWIVGFSDITALHVEAAAVDVASLHAPMVAALGRGHEPAREAWIEAVEHPLRERLFSDLRVLHPGQATGRCFGGNLTVLHACAAAGRLRIPKDCILFLEDVGERPYRVDRTLTTLITGGHLDDVRGVVLGEFTDCLPGQDGVCVEDVLRDTLAPLRIPVAAGFLIGHGLANVPLHFGARAELQAGSTSSVSLGW